MRCLIPTIALLLAVPCGAAEDFRVMRLEQDMRTLERQVQALQRQLSELQQHARRGVEPPLRGAPPAADYDETWLNASAWDRVRIGMSELEVIEILGRPTALRPDAQDRRALLYTLEIGTTGFLSGSVSFDAGKVVEVQRPTLK